MDISSIEKIVSLCKRRGFIFQSSEIYGGLGSTWDYGPLGVEMKQKIKNHWWQAVVTSRDNVVGMDAAILMHPKVWEASGHVSQFHDLMVDNKLTKKRYRLDHLLEAQSEVVIGELADEFLKDYNPAENFDNIQKIVQVISANIKTGKTPDLNQFNILDSANKKDKGKADWTGIRQFNLMFRTSFGSSDESATEAYLRPETAQGIFTNFSNVQTTSRQKLPFGIAQIGKAFRNEITTGNFLFRTREFEQLELEFFVYPDETKKWLETWSQERLAWYIKLGIAENKLRLRPHAETELAHYSKACYDVEYEFPFGWSELEGIADRGTFDLDQHNEHSVKKQVYFDQESNQNIVPAVVEASAGVDRTFLTCLVDAFTEEEVRGEKRILLKLSPQIAPITCAVFPLVKKDGLPDIAEKIVQDIRQEFSAFFDIGGSIGRRYRRQDEAGTPYGITVDHETLEENTVTLRDRDSMEQIRIPTANIRKTLREKINDWDNK